MPIFDALALVASFVVGNIFRIGDVAFRSLVDPTDPNHLLKHIDRWFQVVIHWLITKGTKAYLFARSTCQSSLSPYPKVLQWTDWIDANLIEFFQFIGARVSKDFSGASSLTTPSFLSRCVFGIITVFLVFMILVALGRIAQAFGLGEEPPQLSSTNDKPKKTKKGNNNKKGAKSTATAAASAAEDDDNDEDEEESKPEITPTQAVVASGAIRDVRAPTSDVTSVALKFVSALGDAVVSPVPPTSTHGDATEGEFLVVSCRENGRLAVSSNLSQTTIAKSFFNNVKTFRVKDRTGASPCFAFYSPSGDSGSNESVDQQGKFVRINFSHNSAHTFSALDVERSSVRVFSIQSEGSTGQVSGVMEMVSLGFRLSPSSLLLGSGCATMFASAQRGNRLQCYHHVGYWCSEKSWVGFKSVGVPSLELLSSGTCAVAGGNDVITAKKLSLGNKVHWSQAHGQKGKCSFLMALAGEFIKDLRLINVQVESTSAEPSKVSSHNTGRNRNAAANAATASHHHALSVNHAVSYVQVGAPAPVLQDAKINAITMLSDASVVVVCSTAAGAATSAKGKKPLNVKIFSVNDWTATGNPAPLPEDSSPLQQEFEFEDAAFGNCEWVHCRSMQSGSLLLILIGCGGDFVVHAVKRPTRGAKATEKENHKILLEVYDAMDPGVVIQSASFIGNIGVMTASDGASQPVRLWQFPTARR